MDGPSHVHVKCNPVIVAVTCSGELCPIRLARLVEEAEGGTSVVLPLLGGQVLADASVSWMISQLEMQCFFGEGDILVLPDVGGLDGALGLALRPLSLGRHGLEGLECPPSQVGGQVVGPRIKNGDGRRGINRGTRNQGRRPEERGGDEA